MHSVVDGLNLLAALWGAVASAFAAICWYRASKLKSPPNYALYPSGVPMGPEQTESAMIGEHARLISESGKLNAVAAAWSGAAAAGALVAFACQVLSHFV